MTPFASEVWPARQRNAAQALWEFFRALDEPPVRWDVYGDMQRCRNGEPMRIVAPSVTAKAYKACAEYALHRSLLAQQVSAAGLLTQPVRFATTADLMKYVRWRFGSQAQILAQLAGQWGKLKRRRIEEFGKALFLTKMLCQLPQDLSRDRLYLPLSELEQFGVGIGQLNNGRLDDSVTRLLWKQAVRVREAYGACQGLGLDLTGWTRRRFRRHAMEGLYLLLKVERNKFDVWSKPVALSPVNRVHLRLQLLVGRTNFR